MASNKIQHLFHNKKQQIPNVGLLAYKGVSEQRRSSLEDEIS